MVAQQDGPGGSSLLAQMENGDTTDAVDLTCAAVDLTVEADLDAEKDSRSNRRSADEGDAAEGETDSKGVAARGLCNWTLKRGLDMMERHYLWEG